VFVHPDTRRPIGLEEAIGGFVMGIGWIEGMEPQRERWRSNSEVRSLFHQDILFALAMTRHLCRKLAMFLSDNNATIDCHTSPPNTA
jgi:hypothetical protein